MIPKGARNEREEGVKMIIHGRSASRAIKSVDKEKVITRKPHK